MGHVANTMVVVSLFFIVVSFHLSLALMLGGLALYGVAHIIDGFARSEGSQPPSETPIASHTTPAVH